MRRVDRRLRAAILLAAVAGVATVVAAFSAQGSVGSRGAFGALPLDHYACYPARFSPFKPRAVKLENQFGRATARVLRPIRICAPAKKNAEPMRNRIAHLVCYSLGSVQGPDQESRNASLSNQFGVLPAKVVLIPPESLCLPASKRIGTLIPPAVPGKLDHYLCYKISPARPFERRDGVKVVDQFGGAGDSVLAPQTLCAPTRKNGSALIQPRVHLLCYGVKSGVRGRPATFRTQYGVLRSTIGTRNQLCVPSLKRLTLG
jgi:hypothetical protein